MRAEPPRLAGWEVVGRLDHRDGGPGRLRFAAAGIDRTAWAGAEPWCEHCGLLRRRTITYLVRRGGADIRQICSQAPALYLSTTLRCPALRLPGRARRSPWHRWTQTSPARAARRPPTRRRPSEPPECADDAEQLRSSTDPRYNAAGTSTLPEMICCLSSFILSTSSFGTAGLIVPTLTPPFFRSKSRSSPPLNLPCVTFWIA